MIRVFFLSLQVIVLSALVMASPVSKGASQVQVSSTVRERLTQQGAVDVLVRLREQADLAGADKIQDRETRIRFVYDRLRRQALKTQKNLLQGLQTRGVPHRSFHIENMIAVSQVDTANLAWLEGRSEVRSIELNPQIKQKPLPIDLRGIGNGGSNSSGNIPSSLVSIGVDRVWAELGVKGKGIVIAGQDSGYLWTHPALKTKYRGWNLNFVNHNYNWHDAIQQPSVEPSDDSGHGTHTLGSMLGDDEGENKIGVAPEARWMGCKNMKRGAGTAATYLECFEFFLAPYPMGGDPKTEGEPGYAPHIINNSWACPASEGCKGDEFLAAVRALKAAGIMVVVAVGNEGPGCGSAYDAPGSYSGEVLAVGAYSNYDKDIASFSSRGPSKFNGGLGPDLIAPGSAIRSSVPSGGWGDGLYDHKSGTSMAAPHVAGVVALLWSHKPQLIGKIDETIAVLRRTAKGMTSSQSCGNYPGHKIPNAVMGYGLVDAYRALTE